MYSGLDRNGRADLSSSPGGSTSLSGAPNVWRSRLKEAPDQTNRVLSMVFNSTWFTNFVANSNGIMKFQYELVWREHMETNLGGLAESLASDPVLFINTSARKDQFLMKDLFQP
jgi:hypothetical protein